MTKPEMILAVWNIFVFILYGIDKLNARAHRRRIRETTLISVAFVLGGAGAMFGMIVFNHKTSKIKFRILIPLAMIVNVLAIVAGNIYLV